MEKVKLPLKVAKAIDDARANYGSDFFILAEAYEGKNDATYMDTICGYFEDDYDGLMRTLVAGFEVDPKDLVRNYYEDLKLAEESEASRGSSGQHQFRQGWQSVVQTLEYLGIKIEGINT